MPTKSFCLLMLVLTPWMASGRPTEESVKPASRDSRQMLLPFAPFYQPSFQNYGNPLGAMTPAAKHQLLQALLATSKALSTPNQPLTKSGSKTSPNQKNTDTSLDSNTKTQEVADAGIVPALDLSNLGISPEMLNQIEGRPNIQSLVNSVVLTITNAVIQAILAQLFG